MNRARAELKAAAPADLMHRTEIAGKGWTAAMTAARAVIRQATGDARPTSRSAVETFAQIERTYLGASKPAPLTTRLRLMQQVLHGACNYQGASDACSRESDACSRESIENSLDSLEVFIRDAEELAPRVRKS